MGFVRRRARRRTALVVGGAAYAYGKHRGRQAEAYDDQGAYDQPQDPGYGQPPPQQEYAPPPPPAAPAPSAAIDYDQLAELGKLHADGTLTDEEFAAAKAKILGA
jgi:Short C-terminal domain